MVIVCLGIIYIIGGDDRTALEVDVRNALEVDGRTVLAVVHQIFLFSESSLHLH